MFATPAHDGGQNTDEQTNAARQVRLNQEDAYLLVLEFATFLAASTSGKIGF